MPLPTTFVHLSSTVENSATFHANEPDNAAESKEFSDTSDLSTNLVKLTDTPDSNAITPGMIFSVLSSSCHDQKHKHQNQSKKLTDFVNSTPALITSANNDSDDSLYEFSYLSDEEESGNIAGLSCSPTSSVPDESDIARNSVLPKILQFSTIS